MKTTLYLRMARPRRPSQKPKLAVNVKPNHTPLEDGEGFLPTVAFAVSVDVPDKMFNRAGQVIAELSIPESAAEVAADVKVVES